MTLVDLEPATRRMAVLVADIPDELLDQPTPCPAYAVGDLLDHIGGLTLAFTAAARKETGDRGEDCLVERAPAERRRDLRLRERLERVRQGTALENDGEVFRRAERAHVADDRVAAKHSNDYSQVPANWERGPPLCVSVRKGPGAGTKFLRRGRDLKSRD